MTGMRDVFVGRAVAPLSEADAVYGVIERFHTVVSALPFEVAVTDEERDLTFTQVAGEAAAVRAALAAAGLPPGAPVAVLHSHSAGAVSTILGVLASGYPLLVLDPRTPAPRLSQFLAHARARLCVCDPLLADVAAELADRVSVLPTNGLRPVPVETLWADPVSPEAPAVLAFTSGSTGTPKVVVNDQRMLVVDAWDNAIATDCYGADDVIALTLPMAFHAGLTQAVHGLMVGATIRVYDVRERGIGTLAGWMHAGGVTVMHASPAILRAFVGSAPVPAHLASLRSVTIAGEAAYGKDIEAFRALLPSTCVIHNRYGSSETGLISDYLVTADHSALVGTLPVGRPAGSTQIDLLADDGTPVPPGEPGIIAITRNHLASGYWGNQGATDAAFWLNPDGSTTYRSNDIGRFDERGLTILGRRDHSVKVRGYLVEPGEVDAALFTLPDVREALTVGVPRGESGHYRLISYVVSAAERPSAAGVRSALRGLLPGHMVPESVVFLTALPRTERGKLDRAALPPPPPVEVGEAPISEWERLVAQVWARALELDEVGRNADFFELGGDSLAAEALASMVINDLGVPASDVTPALLAEAPTLAEFARRLKRKPDRRNQTLTALQPAGTRIPLFLVAGGGGLGVGFVPVARHFPADQPCWALHSHALERRGLPDWSVQAAARRNVSILRKVQARGPYYLAGHSFGGLVALEMAQQLRRAGEDVGLLIVLDSFPPDPALQPSESPKTLTRWARDTVGLAVTGLVPTPGVGQYWRFHRQSMVLGKRYRTTPYPGRTLVVLAESEDKDLRSQWGPHLCGPWEMRTTKGDHLSMLREPFAEEVASFIVEGLTEARAGLLVESDVVPVSSPISSPVASPVAGPMASVGRHWF
jgi:acyl-coenzyme A synthetase/AMP-(fatty) acid ligase/thioesterase domain-containing protein